MRELSLEDTIIVLQGMKVILGLCQTEKEALDNAIAYLEGIQESTESEED